MAKSFAYLSPFGGLADKVTAKQIERRRCQEFHGQPTGQLFYSSHKPGNRKPVKHVMKGGTSYFAYINNDGSGGGVGGESLNHQLFKEALISIERARLQLIFNSSTRARRQENISIAVTHAESEKRLVTQNESSRSVDVYLKFETESRIGCKWEQQLYLEVHSTNAVDAEKQTDLRALSVPVVEVDIPDIFVYKFSDENTTDEREAAHKAFIKKILEGPTGFLRCRVLSDPSSRQYLEEQVVLQQKTINELQVENGELVQARAEITTRLEAAESALQAAQSNREDLLAQLNRLSGVHSATARQLAVVKTDLRQAETGNGELKGEIDRVTDALDKKTGEQKEMLETLSRLKSACTALSNQKRQHLIRIRQLWMGLAALLVVGCVSIGWQVSGTKVSSVFSKLLGG